MVKHVGPLRLAFESIESELRCALAKAVLRQRGAGRGGAAATVALAAYAQTAPLGKQNQSNPKNFLRISKYAKKIKHI